jgi:hypothetical protein
MFDLYLSNIRNNCKLNKIVRSNISKAVAAAFDRRKALRVNRLRGAADAGMAVIDYRQCET